MTDEAKALGRAAAAIWAWVPIGEGRVEHVNACGKAADLAETQAREIERLRALLVRGYVVCDGDDEDAVAFRNDAHAALKGTTHDQ